MPVTPKPAARKEAELGVIGVPPAVGAGDGLRDDPVVGVEGVVVLEETTLMSTFWPALQCPENVQIK